MNKSIRINEAIRAQKLRVIDANGEQLGILSLEEALRQADQAGLDLVEISPQASPPVAKIIDWGKYQYQRIKEQQKNRKRAKATELKQMRLGLKIGEHDLDIKLRKIQGFLENGHKVKISIVFRGREMTHKELGSALIKRIITKLGDEVIVEQNPQMAGRNMNVIIRSK